MNTEITEVVPCTIKIGQPGFRDFRWMSKAGLMKGTLLVNGEPWTKGEMVPFPKGAVIERKVSCGCPQCWMQYADE